MRSLKQKFQTNRAPYHFLAYALSFLAYGSIISGVGPLVPYLSEKTGYAQTEYSILFFSRSIGLVVGALILRTLEKKFTFHQILFSSSIVILILCSLLCSILNIIYQAILMLLISIICCFIEVTINLSVLETQKKGNIEFWMLICHGFFGIGGLLGPFLIYFFQTYSYTIMGLMIFTVCPLYYILPTPQKHEQVIKRISQSNYLNELQNLGHQTQYPILEHKPQRNIVGKSIERLICLMCFLYVGLQIGFSSWISSYMVMQQITNKQFAAKFNSLFWVSFTFFRFISPCIPYKPLKKLFLFSYSLCFSTILALIFVYVGLAIYACAFSAIAFGMCISSLFPLLLAVPAEYSLQVSSSQGATFMIWMALGEGTLSTVTGYLMAWFNNDFLFVSMVIIGIGFLISTYYLKDLYEKQGKKQKQLQTIDSQNPEIQLKEIFITNK